MKLLILCLFPLLVSSAPVPEQASENPDIVYGDIMLSERDKMIQKLPANTRLNFFIKEDGSMRWPNNIVPYEISPSYSHDHRQKIEKALKDLEQKTCFKFPKRTNENDYVYYESVQGCVSFVGHQGGKQVISLESNGCVDHGTVLHETMHALGFRHEHQRTDRDNYVDVHLENVEDGKQRYLDIIYDDIYETHGFPYDIKSVMHYHGTSFGKSSNSLTIAFKGTSNPIPDNQVLTKHDIEKINFIGKCSAKSSGSSQTSVNGKPSSKGRKRGSNKKGSNKKRPAKKNRRGRKNRG